MEVLTSRSRQVSKPRRRSGKRRRAGHGRPPEMKKLLMQKLLEKLMA